MMPSVSGQRCSPEFSICVAPPSPARRIIAAAPSPNRLMATILALVSSSSRSASEHSSTATSSTLLPGRACASRAAIDRPDTPPAQPRPNTGTRADVGAESHSAGDTGLETRRRDAGGADGNDGVDIAAAEFRVRQRLFGGLDKQRFGALEKGLGAFRPAAPFEIPFERLYAMALDDAGIGKNARQRFELGQAGSEHVPCRGQNILLRNIFGGTDVASDIKAAFGTKALGIARSFLDCWNQSGNIRGLRIFRRFVN